MNNKLQTLLDSLDSLITYNLPGLKYLGKNIELLCWKYILETKNSSFLDWINPILKKNRSVFVYSIKEVTGQDNRIYYHIIITFFVNDFSFILEFGVPATLSYKEYLAELEQDNILVNIK